MASRRRVQPRCHDERRRGPVNGAERDAGRHHQRHCSTGTPLLRFVGRSARMSPVAAVYPATLQSAALNNNRAFGTTAAGGAIPHVRNGWRDSGWGVQAAIDGCEYRA